MGWNAVHRRRNLSALTAPVAVLSTLAASMAPVAAHAQHPEVARTQTSDRPMAAAQPGAATQGLPASEARPSSYTVVRGDTISSIAARHALATTDVLRWNKLGWSTIIRPGQKIRLTPPTPAVAPKAPAALPATHTVVRGDTVFAIAKKHKTTVAAVLAANDLGPAAIIYPGQKLALPRRAAPAASEQPRTASQKSARLDAEQIDNARLIIRIGRELGVDERGIAIALATAMVESWIRNLDWGDRDSLGLFQQRPSAGWGTVAQLRDRERAIRAFYGGPRGPNRGVTRGLLDIAGWQDMAFGQAAQAVQISAYPERYGQWEAAAYQWLALYG